MKKIGIFYGSTTGTTDAIAHQIAQSMGVASADVHDVAKLTPAMIDAYDVLILGTSTWGAGELQDDWYDGLKVLKKSALSGKTVAIFGCGDSDGYADTFCDGIGLLYEDLKDSGCQIIGSVSTEGYTYDASVAEVDGKFVGLPLDDMNESSLTGERIEHWTADLKALLA